jgi:hypothetical protein
VAAYRIYVLNRADRIASAVDADCETDTAAFTYAAATLGNDSAAEIWQGRRCVGQLRRGVISLGPPETPVATAETIWPTVLAGKPEGHSA